MAWERVIESLGSTPTVHRSAVPGGWLYASFNNMVFVPHPTAQGEKVAPSYDDDTKRRDELGAAYARGFADGKSGKVAPVLPTYSTRTLVDEGTYVLHVAFFRELSDDANVIGKTPADCTDSDLIQQLRKELQEAYNELGIAGRFDIYKVQR